MLAKLMPLALLVLSVLVGTSACSKPSTSKPLRQAQGRPNFIIIFTDDQGYQDLSCFGSEAIHTPHIDQMAAEGRKFTAFYTASPVCTPSRAALLTGCYPKRIEMARGVIFPEQNVGLHPDEVTIADMLKTAGYATACIGKWHLGHRPPFLPTRQGFDTYFGIPYSNDMNHPDNSNKPWGKWDELWADPESTLTRWNTPLMQDEAIIELPVDQRTLTRRYTDKAIEFITANKETPFFVYLPHSMPHLPLYVPDELYDADTDNPYKIVIEHIDAETGRLLQAVKDLGLANNTYIIFTSDNGPWMQFKHHAGSARPLRSGKGSTYEGGPRVPCVMWAPGRIPAGTETAEITSTLDLLPSIATIAGIELQTRGPIDGHDLFAHIHGKAPSPRDELLYYSSRGELDGIRIGEWKFRYAGKERKPELYHLIDDIGERNNLAAAMPEKVAELKERMTALDTEMSQSIRPRGIYQP